MDLVGPLPKSARGHEYILVVVDYATRYPEALPLRKATAKAVAKELFMMCSRVGIPTEILTDQGTPFMSQLTADLCHLFEVKDVGIPSSNGWTCGTVQPNPKEDAPQGGGREWALLDVARDAWDHQPAPHRSMVEHIQQMRSRIDRVMPLVKQHLVEAQRAQQRGYDRPTQPREFQPGDRVLVLTPTATSKFLASWKGPYTVVERVGPVNYSLRQPGCRREVQLYHVNLLKRWMASPTQMAAFAETEAPVLQMGEHLSPVQKQDIQYLVSQFRDVFSEKPGQTRIIQHEIRTPPGVVVRQRSYRVPETRRLAIEKEIKRMKLLGVIEPSRSPWSSPIVMVSKPDGILRFCNDFRRVNEVSTFDGYPMPRVDDLLDRLGKARYITTLDLTKGYWQVPLAPEAREKTAFSTPSGHW
ncbi:protein NYNRIN-like [Triplophysa dalaica]|uniref:protein NYNRIN-like n=1 Tax=Triplophysa dalaica TaxID=1582913 RepID=UPI0024DFDA0D|nr:protein NYNRIN-like [Triplophysa dalaica]